MDVDVDGAEEAVFADVFGHGEEFEVGAIGGLAVAVPAIGVLANSTPASAATTTAAGYCLVVAAENATTKVKNGADYEAYAKLLT